MSTRKTRRRPLLRDSEPEAYHAIRAYLGILQKTADGSHAAARAKVRIDATDAHLNEWVYWDNVRKFLKYAWGQLERTVV